jgi:hypothetical protein
MKELLYDYQQWDNLHQLGHVTLVKYITKMKGC